MELLRIANGELAFGEDKILEKAELSVQTGERICLVGRNGAGKSTLMKILMGIQNLDDGQILKSNTMQMAMLEQDPPESSEQSVFDHRLILNIFEWFFSYQILEIRYKYAGVCFGGTNAIGATINFSIDKGNLSKHYEVLSRKECWATSYYKGLERHKNYINDLKLKKF